MKNEEKIVLQVQITGISRILRRDGHSYMHQSYNPLKLLPILFRQRLTPGALERIV